MLFTFPSRYWYTIGHRGVLRLGGWSPHFQTGFHVSRLTRGRYSDLTVRGCHPLWPTFPDGSGFQNIATGLIRVRSPLLTEFRLISFPRVTEMFQFTRFASCTYVFSARSPEGGVSPFGNSWIKACSRLPMTYRSVPRPSSPLCTKASTRCPLRRLIASRRDKHPRARHIFEFSRKDTTHIFVVQRGGYKSSS